MRLKCLLIILNDVFLYTTDNLKSSLHFFSMTKSHPKDFSSAYLKEDHACQILENGWHHLFRELIVSAKNKLNAVEMISAVIKAGNEEDMLCVFKRIGKFDPNCYSLLISSGNTKWIEMYRKHFCLPAIHF